jgi:glutamate N-acetyltransferase/amino-acid N-acetyltransferase
MVELTVHHDNIPEIEALVAGGAKSGKYGLAVFKISGSAAAVYTTNKVKAAPLIVTKKNLKEGKIEGIIANSGNANAFTGKKGLQDAKEMAGLLADRLGINPGRVAVASTGVIGRYLDMDRITSLVDNVCGNLKRGNAGLVDAAKAIMTTDTFPKVIGISGRDLRVVGVAKGAGMIAPSMATMLGFIFTNATFKPSELRAMLRKSVDKSFNMVVVDGDTSTNDMVILTASNEVEIDKRIFQRALDAACIELAKMIARDGEGSTKCIEVRVAGARSFNDARRVAKAIVSSNLVKSAIYGADPNWGRVVAAIGYARARFDLERLSVTFGFDDNEVTMVMNGEIAGEEQLKRASELMKENKKVTIIVNLGVGNRSAVAWGCDLTPEYVRINSEYTT